MPKMTDFDSKSFPKMTLKSSCAWGFVKTHEKKLHKNSERTKEINMEQKLKKMTLKSSCALGSRENSIQKSMLKMTDFDPQKPSKNDSEIELCRGDS